MQPRMSYRYSIDGGWGFPGCLQIEQGLSWSVVMVTLAIIVPALALASTPVCTFLDMFTVHVLHAHST